jgi:histidine triad (HIT) family protein
VRVEPTSKDDFYCAEVLSGRASVAAVNETPLVIAFRHTRPMFETHIVVIPKRHIGSLLDPSLTDAELLALLHVVKEVAREVLAERGASRVQTNLGSYQDSKHLHWHVYAGERLG